MRSALKYSILSMACLAAGCASTDLGQRSVDHIVTDKSSAEAGFEMQSKKIEEDIQNSGQLIRDPILKNYLVNLTDNIIGDYAGQLRIYPVEAPAFNAAILPNGAMIVYSGLMLRAENEAQLALVLGHEFGHFFERHSLERRAAAENAVWGSFIVGGILATALYLDFSQENELEADVIGLEKLSENGYDSENAIMLWKNLADEMSNSTNKKVRKRADKNSAVFATHPTTKERIEALDANVLKFPEGTKLEQERYRAIIRPHLKDWLEAELTRRDYGSLFHLIDRLSGLGGDKGVLEYMRGRTHATRNEEGDSEKALEAYLAATQHSDAPPVVYKVMGDVYNDIGETAKARTAFETYLSRAPEAEDRELIQYMISNLGS